MLVLLQMVASKLLLLSNYPKKSEDNIIINVCRFTIHVIDKSSPILTDMHHISSQHCWCIVKYSDANNK